MPRVPLHLVAPSVCFYSELDETAFFGWLKQIDCVSDLRGVGEDLIIALRRQPGDGDLRELLAVFWRYSVDMRQLARFASDRRKWFADPRAYWHEAVFGSAP